MAELGDREIGGQRCLFAFLADDTNPCPPKRSDHLSSTKILLALTDISRLNHADIITAVTNTAYAFFRIASYQSGNVCLLSWGTPAGHDSGELGRDLNELVFEQVQTQLKAPC